MGVSKTVGDLAGPCLFAMFMGISRVLCGNLEIGLLVATIFPLMLIFVLLVLNRKFNRLSK